MVTQLRNGSSLIDISTGWEPRLCGTLLWRSIEITVLFWVVRIIPVMCGHSRGLARWSLRFQEENRNAILPNPGLVVVFHLGRVGSRPMGTRNDKLRRAAAQAVIMRIAA